jgi:hypothetical protein
MIITFGNPKLQKMAGGIIFPSQGVIAGDITPPTLSSVTPADNSVGVSTTTQLTMNFSESVMAGVGTIDIKKTSDNSVFQSIGISSGQVSISGSTVTVTPTALAGTTGYYINIASGVITDLAGNAYAGISTTTAWNFTTGAAPAAASGSHNWNTGGGGYGAFVDKGYRQ